MKKVHVAVLSGFGINADTEMAEAFRRAGACTELVHVDDLRTGIVSLDAYTILAFPGGFSFGDHLGSGKVLSHIIKKSIRGQIEALIARGGLVLGICNGFQALVKMGMIPDLQGNWEQNVSLVHNACGTFVDCWVQLRVNPANNSPWLRGISGFKVPARHGEGRLVLADERIGYELQKRNLIACTYMGDSPNGSWANVAGLTDSSGQILGMMPHPECFLDSEQDPQSARPGKEPESLALFHNAVQWIREIS